MDSDGVHEAQLAKVIDAAGGKRYRGLIYVGIVVTVLVSLGVIGFLDHQRKQLRTIERVAEDNQDLLQIVLTITGCTVDQTVAECKAAFAETERIEGARRIAEVDCRTRLAIERRPPVPPDKSCVQETGYPW